MSMISEIVNYLENNSVGTRGTNLFYSQVPDRDADFVIGVFDRSGTKPSIDIKAIKSPMFQVFIKAKDYDTGKAKLDSVRSLLQNVTDTYLINGGVYFRRIQATSEGGHLGLNPDNNKDEFSINFMAEIIE